MKIVKLKESSLASIKKVNPYFHKEGIGLAFEYEGHEIFIPITSVKKVPKNQYQFLPIGKESSYGTLLIVDYIYIDKRLYTLAKESKRIEEEIRILKSEKKEIERKLRYQINRSRTGNDIKKKKLLNEILNPLIGQTLSQIKKYTEKALESMSVLEKVRDSEEILEAVINYKVFEKETESIDVETIIKIKDAWKYLERTIFEPLDIQYIIRINEIIASHQALEVGDIKKGFGYVAGKYEVPPISKEELIDSFKKILSSDVSTVKKAFNIFYSIITNQWFYDGNKRTAFIVMNKLLISEGIGILLFSNELQEEFDRLLDECYQYRNRYYKERFFEFLESKCIEQFT